MENKKRGVRGAANLSGLDMSIRRPIEFDIDGNPTGEFCSNFISWLGVHCKNEIPYWITSRDIKDEIWEGVWTAVQREWRVVNCDTHKKVFIRSLGKKHTDWRANLNVKYAKTNINPFAMYGSLDPDHWNEFREERGRPEVQKRSAQATLAAKANTNLTTLGRAGLGWMTEERVGNIFADIQQKQGADKVIESMHNSRSKKWIACRAKKNKKTGVYGLPPELLEDAVSLAQTETQMKKANTYDVSKVIDPLTVVKGAEHPGRTRGRSIYYGVSKLKDGLLDKQSDASQPNDNATDLVGCFEIPNLRVQEPTRCKLLMPYKGEDDIVGTGMLYPSDGTQILDGYVRVKVIEIVEDALHNKIPKAMRYDQFMYLEDCIGWFIQWPLYAIQLMNAAPQPPPPVHIHSRSSPEASYHSPARPESQFNLPSSFHPPSPSAFQTESVTFDQCYKPVPLDTNERASDQVDRVDMAGPIDLAGLINLAGPISQEAKASQPRKKAKVKPEADKKIEKTSKKHKEMISRKKKLLANRSNDFLLYGDGLCSLFSKEFCLPFRAPSGMYGSDDNDEFIEFDLAFGVLLNEWIDSAFLHSYEMILYETTIIQPPNCPYPTSRSTFLNPTKVNGHTCQDGDRLLVVNHILEVTNLHRTCRYFILPFHHRDHWVLCIFSFKDKKGYIWDSAPPEDVIQDPYPFKSVLDAIFGRFVWTMGQCPIQPGSFECVYITLYNMVSFYMRGQFFFPEHEYVSSELPISQGWIDLFLTNVFPR